MIQLTAKSSQRHIWVNRPTKFTQTWHVRILEVCSFRIRGVPTVGREKFMQREEGDCNPIKVVVILDSV